MDGTHREYRLRPVFLTSSFHADAVKGAFWMLALSFCFVASATLTRYLEGSINLRQTVGPSDTFGIPSTNETAYAVICDGGRHNLSGNGGSAVAVSR